MNLSGAKDYYIHQNWNFSGNPNFSIENTKTKEVEMTVTLESCCFNAYNCTDVVYDVTSMYINVYTV